MDFLELNSFLNNTLRAWATAFGVFLIAIAVLRIVKGVLLAKFEAFAAKTDTKLDDILVELMKATHMGVLLVLAVYTSSHFLILTPKVEQILKHGTLFFCFLQVALWGNAAIAFFVETYVKEKGELDGATATTIGLLRFSLKAVLYTIVVLLMLNNMGVDISALVAGLGVGGVAIALALQKILGDLFASLTIVLDRPFVIGDYIMVGEFQGTIEKIGLKSTRIRSISGEQLVFSNSDLLQGRIRNYKHMNERRVVFRLNVAYDTPRAKIQALPDHIQTLVTKYDSLRFDRAHLATLGPYSIEFEIVYWVLVADYRRYMDMHQAINLDILSLLEKEGIRLAYPTQTILNRT